MKEIAVVVVTYNRLALLRECISAIRGQSVDMFQIVVINNGSTDGTGEWLAAQKDIITITQPNSGGAGGFCAGLKYSAEQGYRYSWIMDDDTMPTANALEEMLAAKSHLDDFGFLCSKVVDPSGNACNCPMIDVETKGGNGELLWLDKSEYGILRVRIASFVSVFVNNTYVHKLGLPYAEFFIWGDDTEYTMRLSDNAECFIVLKSVVLHKRVLSQILSIYTETDPNRIRNWFYAYRNRIFTSAKSSKMKAFGYWSLSLVDAGHLLLKCQWRKACVIIRATISAMFFSPKIKYPSNES